MSQQKQKIELNAERRVITGAKVDVLRQQGVIPAVLYGKGMEAISLQVPVKDFDRTLKEAGESTLVYVTVDGQAYPTIIKDVARHPLRNTALHADFYKVRLDEKVKAMVPVVFEGESPAVKDTSGVFVRNINELEVEALPQNLPHEITIDISVLKQVGDQITVGDVKLDKGVELTAGPDEVLALIQAAITAEQLEAQLAEPTTDVSAVEEIKPEREAAEGEEGEAAEGAAPAEEKKE